MLFGKTTPILRIFDEAKAKEFYVDFLGFQIDWEHRFEKDAPLYMQISRDNCILHLSEHHGDCSPGAAMRIACRELDDYCKELQVKNTSTATLAWMICPMEHGICLSTTHLVTASYSQMQSALLIWNKED